ncbi:MAG: glycoside hydrolase family 5 protein [Treponema sp.]|jgi:endoglucanase|nr:glycoside hydrolase family 5 protein [Treponema sp.]
MSCINFFRKNKNNANIFTYDFAGKTTALPVPTAEKLPSSWKGFNLLNMFYFKGRQSDIPFDEKDFKMMSEWGFNFARIPVDYRILIKSNDWNNMNETAMQRLDKAVEFGIKHDIHICLNLHRAPGFTVATPAETANLWTQAEPQAAFARMWAFFAARYKNVPNEYLSFNFVNEPTGVDEKTYADVIKIAANAIRAHDPNRILIADGLDYGTIPCYMIKDLGIAQATRGYAPHPLTHYKAGWVEGADKYPLPAWPNVTENAPEQNREWLKNTLKPWNDLAKSGSGVVVGEWGSHNKTPHDVVLRWMEDNLIIFKEAGLGWALWNLSGSFGVLNSGRDDVQYENYNGYKLDRKMLTLLQKYLARSQAGCAP